jgi:hypothetical protein
MCRGDNRAATLRLDLLIAARARWHRASAMFVAAGGPALLGIESQ